MKKCTYIVFFIVLFLSTNNCFAYNNIPIPRSQPFQYKGVWVIQSKSPTPDCTLIPISPITPDDNKAIMLADPTYYCPVDAPKSVVQSTSKPISGSSTPVNNSTANVSVYPVDNTPTVSLLNSSNQRITILEGKFDLLMKVVEVVCVFILLEIIFFIAVIIRASRYK